jgi:predicted nucleic acid-binding protein
VILVDTSAWVEFLRGTGSDANIRVRNLLERDEIATTDVVLMELLAGARDESHRDGLRSLLARCQFTPTAGPSDYESAADLYRACRRAGHTVRALTDCLIASVAIRAGLALVHADADFETLARYTRLEIA